MEEYNKSFHTQLGVVIFFVSLRKMKYLTVVTSMLTSEPDNKILFKSIGDTGIVAFRGTQTLEDIWYDIDIRPKKWPPDDFSSHTWVPRLAGPKFKAYYEKQGLNAKTYNFFTTNDPVVFLCIPPVYQSVGTFIHLPYEDSNVLIHHDFRTYHKLIKQTLRHHECLTKKNVVCSSSDWYKI